jgi:hypothetical protein
MGIYLFRKARDALTNEDRRDKEYRRRARERKDERSYNKSMKDRENALNVFNRTADSFDNGMNTVGKETVGVIGKTLEASAKS